MRSVARRPGRWLRAAGAGVVLAVAGACSFERPADVLFIDAQEIDAAPTCVAGTTTCASSRFVECGPDGFPVRSIDCPLGCAPDQAACQDLDPHNGLAI